MILDTRPLGVEISGKWEHEDPRGRAEGLRKVFLTHQLAVKRRLDLND
jgi:hypothetical protein